ncbi:MAG TPA: DUF2283 domain-containing protein [Stellaceae bacterium]|nr:DUF2283 domain-containing protein [Stellaceae bacterium]
MAAGVTYDPEADALTISFTAAPTVEGEEVHPGVILHFDATDRIVAIEALHVSKTLAKGAVSLLRQPANSAERVRPSAQEATGPDQRNPVQDCPR